MVLKRHRRYGQATRRQLRDLLAMWSSAGHVEVEGGVSLFFF